MSGEEGSTYDPLISGLEPEPFDAVFQELFSGVKCYFAIENEKEKEPTPVPESLSDYRPDENTPQPASTLDVTPLPDPEPQEQSVKTTRTRQYAMLCCGMCSEWFVSEFALEHHEAKTHTELFQWSCYECDVQFDSLKDASDHAIMTHGESEMPVFDFSYLQYRKQGLAMFMQMITRRSSDFVKQYLISRNKRVIMTTSYFTYAKCELQAVYTGNIGLVMYHQSKGELLHAHHVGEQIDLVSCLKKAFIYGNFIRRVPLITYTPPTTVYRTLKFSNVSTTKAKKARPAKPGTTLRDVVAKYPPRAPSTAQTYVVKSNVRAAPYAQQRVRTVVRVPIKKQHYQEPIQIRQVNSSIYLPPIRVQQ